MDNLTHSLVGWLIARGAPAPAVPRATALCIVAANVPDVDIVSMFDPAAYLTYHRHITHSLAAIPFMAAFAVLLVNLRGDRPERSVLWRQWALALAAVGSHVALDMMNSYGMRLWLPFSSEWSSWDLFFIIDPLIWLLLAAAVLVSRPLPVRQTTARLGLAALVAYGLASLWIRNGVEARIARTNLARETPIELRVLPAPWRPWDWSAYVHTDAGQFLLDPASGATTQFAPADADMLDALRATSLGKAYLDFAQLPIVMTEADGVTLGDIRFLRGGRVNFACRFDVDAAGNLSNGRFEF